MPKSITVEALKPFVRKIAPHYLDQPNVTSVGIGYKQVAGKPTKQLSIQFTVGKKAAPEALEALGTERLPEMLEVDGIKVPTDVIERAYDVHLRAPAALRKPNRKKRLDPIVPGVSIAHIEVTAGTAGAVVYDARTGAPYVLSNWHVLQGETGKIGDPISQPGSFDDNRVEQNLCGHLVRSHLGVAGDCAIATIEGRQLGAEILDFKVAVEQVAEPDLGDKVMKSGRTTAVTHGIVARVHVTTRLDYGGTVGAQDIGGFEIQPDPDHPDRDGEISMGGDSGAAWMRVERGKPTSTMVGLHFAGETGDDPEHALACYAESVFQKLEIVSKPPRPADIEPEAGRGFAPSFLERTVALPRPASRAVENDLAVVGGRAVVDYTHFSLAMSKSRRFARWVAWNIDGGSIKRITRTGIPFKKDPGVPAEFQVGDELYRANPLDRGHIARRQDLLWGAMAEAEQANIDSFFFTNITPQHAAFNQSGAHGIWGELENAIFSDVDVADLRVSVIGGPIFGDLDPEYRQVRLPKEFYKILYWRERGNAVLKAKGYVLTQTDLINELEALELPEFAVFEVPIGEISRRTDLILPTAAEPEGIEAASARKAEAAANPRIRRVGSAREILG
jgi:endonuclease G